MDSKYDVFISHASEDKDSIARPLAKALTDFDVRVWFDEFTLEVGDSLSRSIDRGLASSRYGIVILSNAFLSKDWPEYELRGLVSKEMGRDKVILPIWHEISRDEIVEYSPPLADKIALNTSSQSLDEIILQILRVVRPDIFENVYRYIQWRELLAESEEGRARLGDLKPSKIRHKELPESLLIRAKIVCHILGNVAGLEINEFIDNLRRDMQPIDEIKVWERIAAAFLDIASRRELGEKERKRVFSQLLGVSLHNKEGILRLYEEGDDDFREVILAYINVVPKIDRV